MGNWAIAKIYLTRNLLAKSILVSHYRPFTFLDVSCHSFSPAASLTAKLELNTPLIFREDSVMQFFLPDYLKEKTVFEKSHEWTGKSAGEETGKAGTRNARPREALPVFL